MPVVEFFFDIISPYSRIQYDLLMRQLGHWKSMELKMTPVVIRKIFTEAENPPPGMNPRKAVYLFNDLLMVSKYHKIPFAVPQNFMQIAFEKGSEKAQHFLTAIQNEIDVETFHRLVGKYFYHFFHPDDFKMVLDAPIMTQVAQELGISQAILDKASGLIDDESTKNKLEKNTERCLELGAFGLPVTCVHLDEPQWVFGSDRMHILGMLLGEKEPPKLK